MNRVCTSGFLFLLMGCSTVSQETEEERARFVMNEIIAADNRGDLERVVSLYHSNAVLVPAGRPVITGREAIRKNYENIFSTSQLKLVLEIEELTTGDGFAVSHGFTRGHVVLNIDSSVREVNDRFMMMLEKENGEWKIKRLMWGPAQ